MEDCVFVGAEDGEEGALGVGAVEVGLLEMLGGGLVCVGMGGVVV